MISLANGLRISVTNLDALKSGKIVGAFSKTFLAIDRSFALYPDIQIEGSDTITVEFWAECKNCESIDNTFPLTRLSEITALPIEELENIFQQRASIFLLSLRVYELPSSIQVQQQATGNFVPLSETIIINEKSPVLNDEQFQTVQEQSKDLDLQVISNKILINYPTDNGFDIQIISSSPKSDKFSKNPQNPIVEKNIEDNQKLEDTEVNWIKTISTLGDRSIEKDTGTSNYQAGTDFENIVRKALEFIGFKADYTHKGGAGGLDLLCLEPYALFGECKAGKKIPNDTAVQLLNLGTLRRRELFSKAVKLIIGAGKPTHQLEDAAKVHGMAIINAVTLQKLVELKSQHLGAVDLIELKKYFVGGQSNQEIEKYIEKVKNDIKLRSHVVNLVKKTSKEIGIDYIFGVYENSEYPKSLTDEELFEILIELSSPLAGYLGRVKGDGRTGDRFYYLRDLLT